MLQFSGSALCVDLGPFTSPAAFAEVDCQFAPEPGSFLRVQEAHGIHLISVVVAIQAESSGLLEKSLATYNPLTDEWQYVRKTKHPAREGALLQITAVPRGPQPASTLVFEQSPESIWIRLQCGSDSRRILAWETWRYSGEQPPRSVIISVLDSATVAQGCFGA